MVRGGGIVNHGLHFPAVLFYLLVLTLSAAHNYLSAATMSDHGGVGHPSDVSPRPWGHLLCHAEGSGWEAWPLLFDRLRRFFQAGMIIYSVAERQGPSRQRHQRQAPSLPRETVSAESQ